MNTITNHFGALGSKVAPTDSEWYWIQLRNESIPNIDARIQNKLPKRIQSAEDFQEIARKTVREEFFEPLASLSSEAGKTHLQIIRNLIATASPGDLPTLRTLLTYGKQAGWLNLSSEYRKRVACLPPNKPAILSSLFSWCLFTG